MPTSSKATIEVPLLDLRAQYDTLRDEIEPVVKDVIESQWFIGGPQVSGLEEEIARYCSVSHAVGCASGSDAITLALQALDIGPGDFVACPDYSFFSTAGSIWRLGARPLLVDIDPSTYNIDPDALAEALASVPRDRIKAIMPVHLFGQCCDMDRVAELAAQYEVPIIEDAAQAIGSEDVHGRRAGSMGAAGCFSFFPSKNLGGFGDGGILTFNDESLAQRCARLRNHGMEPKYYHHEVGENSRLDALQAAVLRVKLRHLDAWSEGRRDNARFYDAQIAAAGGCSSRTPIGEAGDLPLRFPHPAEQGRHIYNQYVVRVPAEHRDGVRARMAEAKIGTEIYYPLPLHSQVCFKGVDLQGRGLTAAASASAETIAIPIYPDMSDDQRTHVVETLVSIVRSI